MPTRGHALRAATLPDILLHEWAGTLQPAVGGGETPRVERPWPS